MDAEAAVVVVKSTAADGNSAVVRDRAMGPNDSPRLIARTVRKAACRLSAWVPAEWPSRKKRPGKMPFPVGDQVESDRQGDVDWEVNIQQVEKCLVPAFLNRCMG